MNVEQSQPGHTPLIFGNDHGPHLYLYDVPDKRPIPGALSVFATRVSSTGLHMNVAGCVHPRFTKSMGHSGKTRVVL